MGSSERLQRSIVVDHGEEFLCYCEAECFLCVSMWELYHFRIAWVIRSHCDELAFVWKTFIKTVVWADYCAVRSLVRLIDWSSGSSILLIDWLIDWLINWFSCGINWLIDWLIDWLIKWFSYGSIGWLIGWLVGWLVLDWLIDWSGSTRGIWCGAPGADLLFGKAPKFVVCVWVIVVCFRYSQKIGNLVHFDELSC